MLDLNANYYHTPSFAWSPDGRVREGAYGLLNTDIGFGSADDRYRLSFWARNITKTKYSIFTFVSPFGDLYSPGSPRTYGVTASFKFN